MKTKSEPKRKISKAKHKKTRQGSSVNTKTAGKHYRGQGR